MMPQDQVYEQTGNAPFMDTPLLKAKRKAFDYPTIENLDALITEARADCVKYQDALKEIGWGFGGGHYSSSDAYQMADYAQWALQQ